MKINNVESIKNAFIALYKNKQYITDKTNVKTIELIGASFIADSPTIFGKLDDEYIKREIEWYKSQSLSVHDIPGKTPQIWNQVSSTSGKINSNYGYLIYSKENHNQYKHVFKELSTNSNSRRAVMIYQRPTMHCDYNKDGMSDFICTNAVQYVIRNNLLNAIVQMRSNDVVFGYRNDYAWQKCVQERLADDLHVGVGDITWQVGSLHIYERHFKLIEKEIKNAKTQKLTDNATRDYYKNLSDHCN